MPTRRIWFDVDPVRQPGDIGIDSSSTDYQLKFMDPGGTVRVVSTATLDGAGDGTSVFALGESGTPYVEDTAGTNVFDYWIDCGNTSGWNAGLYLTGYATGAAGNFTSIEGDVYVTAAVANTTGIESFMNFASGGKVTGHAAACQATVDYANAALAFGGGAYMAGRFNIKGEGSSCDPSGAIRQSCIELQTQGTFASGKKFEETAAAYAVYLNGFTSASGTGSIISSTNPNVFPTGTLGVRWGVGADGAAGTAYYVPLIPATTWLNTNRLDMSSIDVSASNTDGGVIRMGTSGSPITEDTAGMNFVMGYFDSGATSGWPAALYLHLAATGTTAFTALQGDMTVSATATTVTGIESFMAFTSPGKVSGAARACQGTIDFGNYEITTGGGVYSAGCFNIKGEGSACDPSLAQRIQCIELKTEGTFETNKDFEKKAAAYAIYFNGFSGAAGTGSILTTTTLTIGAGDPANVVGIRVGVGGDADAGTAYYIPLVPAAEWN